MQRALASNRYVGPKKRLLLALCPTITLQLRASMGIPRPSEQLLAIQAKNFYAILACPDDIAHSAVCYELTDSEASKSLTTNLFIPAI